MPPRRFRIQTRVSQSVLLLKFTTIDLHVQESRIHHTWGEPSRETHVASFHIIDCDFGQHPSTGGPLRRESLFDRYGP